MNPWNQDCMNEEVEGFIEFDPKGPRSFWFG